MDAKQERGNAFFRFLDRYAGILLVQGMRPFTPTGRPKPKHPGKIVLIKMGAIGDSILTLPFIRKIKLDYPKAEITVICGRNNQAVYQNSLQHGHIDDMIVVAFNRMMSDVAYGYRKMKQIRACRADFCIDFDSWYRISALIARLVQAEYRVGFKRNEQGKDALFDQSISHLSDCHEFENYQRLTEGVMGKVEQWPRYITANEDASFYRKFCDQHEIDQFMVFHPWASGTKSTRKQLDRKAMLYVGNELAAKGFPVIITGGKEDAKQSEALAAMIERAFSIAGQTSLNETAVFLAKAHRVVTVNTGILHLAAAVDSRIVSINGPTDIKRWGPLSDKAVNIKSSLICSPCLDLGFEYECKQNGVPAGHCMSKIDLDEIVRAAVQHKKDAKKTAHS